MASASISACSPVRISSANTAEESDLVASHHGLARAILNVLVERPPDFDTVAVGARIADILLDMDPAMGEFLSGRELTSTSPGLVLRMGIISAITNVVLLPQTLRR